MSAGIRRSAALLGLLAIVALPALASADPVEAAWSDRELATVSPTAGSLSPLTKVAGCQIGLLGSSATVAWTNPTTGVARTGIVWGLYGPGDVIVGSETFTSGTGAPSSASLTVPGSPSGLTAAGTYTLRVQTYVGTSWRSTAVTGTIRFTAGILGVAIADCSWAP